MSSKQVLNKKRRVFMSSMGKNQLEYLFIPLILSILVGVSMFFAYNRLIFIFLLMGLVYMIALNKKTCP